MNNEKKDFKISPLLTNISKHFQLISALIEQANQDQKFLYKPKRLYIRLENLVIKIICDLEILRDFMNSLEHSRIEFLSILKKNNFSKPMNRIGRSRRESI